MAQGKDGTILIIEDDEGVARLQQRRLERAGYRVAGAGTAEAALEKIRAGGVELILLDYRLPGDRTGLDVYTQLKASGYDLPVIMVTGFSDEATVVKALRLGVRDFVTKSAEYLDYLPEAVERVLKQVHTETQLAASEARLAAIINSAMDPILTMDYEGRITFWNPSAEKLYGWTVLEAMGKNSFELLFKDSAPTLEEVRKTLMQKGEWHGEVRQITKTGKEIVVLSRWTLIGDKESQPQSILVINNDITEKKKLENQHLRAQRMESLGILAGGIAHDLNNVLTPILMGIEILNMRFADAESQALVKTLQDSAERGAAMVKQVLSFARGTEGERVPVSLRNASKECQRMLEHTLPKSIRLEFSLPSDLWLISADVTQIAQVLMNLCVNARDAMPHGGRLSVSAHNQTVDEYYAQMHADARPGPYVVLSVSDTGTGIPPEILDRIFEPFFTTKRPGEGTGLGLSTVLGIVKSHSGFVNVYSEIGAGTRFSVYLPAAETAAVEQAAQEHHTLLRGRGELILVVDDDLAICEITKSTLEMYGYRALIAGDGAEAVALFLENRGQVKLVLTDMSMPVMDGAATIRAMRKIDPYIVIIAATGLTVGGQTGVAQAGGVQAFLHKPYSADKLLTVVREVLDKRSESDHGSLRTSSSLSQDKHGGKRLSSCAEVP